MDGLLRSNTRLCYSDNLLNSMKYPIILRKKHPVTIQIIKYHHKREEHEMGLNYTLNHLRKNCYRSRMGNGKKGFKRLHGMQAKISRKTSKFSQMLEDPLSQLTMNAQIKTLYQLQTCAIS